MGATAQETTAMQTSARKPRPSISRALLWTGAVVLVLLVAIVGLASIHDWNFARGRIASIASSMLGEPVSIDGNLSAHLLSTTPSLLVEKIRVANPDWAATDDLTHNFATIDRLAVALNLGQLFRGHVMLETLEIDNPQVAIVSNEEGRYNFSRAEAKEENQDRKPPKFPGVRKLTMRGGQVYVSDAVHKLKFKGIVEANEQAARPEDIPFHLRGEGTLNNEPFALIFQGGALANIKMDEPYEFDADVKAGKTHATAKGKFEKPFDAARLNLRLDVQGDNLAHLYYLTNLALPFTPPYRISGDLSTSERNVAVKGLKGVIGKSDINGDVVVDLKGERPKLTAELKSHSLNLADLSPAFGKGVTKDSDTGRTQDSQAPKALPPTKLLPTYQFEFDRLKVMDAAVTLHADSVQTVQTPFTGVDIKVVLNDSVLELNPLVFTLPQGKIDGAIHIDARKKPAAEKVDLRLTNVDLNQFKGKDSPAGPLGGELEARAQLAGTGNSVHDFAASADGKITAILPQGEIRRAFAELLGINVANGLGLLLTKSQQRSNVRCGVATFDVNDGAANVQQLVIDTDVVRIEGNGQVNLNSEALDLDLKGQPKKFRLLRLKTPVTVNGTLRKPSIGVKAGDAAKQVGIAAAVGSVLAPLAAAIAFIDPGLAKDENCAALLAEAEMEKPKTDRIQEQHPTPTKDKS